MQARKREIRGEEARVCVCVRACACVHVRACECASVNMHDEVRAELIAYRWGRQ
jgi:hypothetical protein